MKLKEYIIACKRTSRGLSTKKERLTNFALGLAGETAEVNELINGKHTNSLEKPLFRKDIVCEEVGDVLWYTSMLIHETYDRDDFSADYDALTKWGSGEILFIGHTDYYNKETKSIDIGLLTNRISTIAGNISDAIKKHVFHEKPLDHIWVIARLGDIFWMCKFFLQCCNLTIEETMDKNVAKLKERYPDGFSPEMSIKKLDE